MICPELQSTLQNRGASKELGRDLLKNENPPEGMEEGWGQREPLMQS